MFCNWGHVKIRSKKWHIKTKNLSHCCRGQVKLNLLFIRLQNNLQIFGIIPLAVCFWRPPFGLFAIFWDRVLWWPNTNKNIIRFPKNDRIRIRILFGFPKMTKYKYKYYSVSQKWPNANTNIIWFPKNDRIWIRILFSYPEMTEYKYEYHPAPQ